MTFSNRNLWQKQTSHTRSWLKNSYSKIQHGKCYIYIAFEILLITNVRISLKNDLNKKNTLDIKWSDLVDEIVSN